MFKIGLNLLRMTGFLLWNKFVFWKVNKLLWQWNWPVISTPQWDHNNFVQTMELTCHLSSKSCQLIKHFPSYPPHFYCHLHCIIIAPSHHYNKKNWKPPMLPKPQSSHLATISGILNYQRNLRKLQIIKILVQNLIQKFQRNIFKTWSNSVEWVVVKGCHCWM